VVPSERTKVSVKVSESVISLLASRQPTALVLQIGELSVATDLVDQMTDAEVQISVPQLHVLLSEDRDAEKDSASASVTAGIAYVDVMARWKVSDLSFDQNVLNSSRHEGSRIRSSGRGRCCRRKCHSTEEPCEPRNTGMHPASLYISFSLFFQIVVNNGRIGVHLCADTAIALTALISDLQPPSTVDVDAPRSVTTLFNSLCMM
jgi:hypothetical protein